MRTRTCLSGVFLAVLSGLALCSPGWSAQSATAVLDSERVLKEMRKTKLAEGEIERQKEDFKAEMGRMQDKLRKLEEQFEEARQQSRNKALSEAAVKEKMEEAEKKLVDVKQFEKEMRSFADQRKQQLMEQSMRMRKRFKDEIREAVRKYAEEKGILVVIDSSRSPIPEFQEAVVYRADSVDITDKIIQAVNSAEGAKDGGKE